MASGETDKLDLILKQIGDIHQDLTGRIDRVDASLTSKIEQVNEDLREEFNQRMDEMMAILDSHTKILERLDQKRFFTFERVKRLEDEVQKIKIHLNIS